MPAGRPSDYKPDFCDRIVELGAQGASVAEMAFELGVTKPTLTNWAEAHPEFLSAFTRAKLASQVWWERKGRDGMEKSSSEFQASIWSRSMAARFPDDWREVKGTELTGKDGGPVQQEMTIDPASLPDEVLRAILAAKVNAAK